MESHKRTSAQRSSQPALQIQVGQIFLEKQLNFWTLPELDKLNLAGSPAVSESPRSELSPSTSLECSDVPLGQRKDHTGGRRMHSPPAVPDTQYRDRAQTVANDLVEE